MTDQRFNKTYYLPGILLLLLFWGHRALAQPNYALNYLSASPVKSKDVSLLLSQAELCINRQKPDLRQAAIAYRKALVILKNFAVDQTQIDLLTKLSIGFGKTHDFEDLRFCYNRVLNHYRSIHELDQASDFLLYLDNHLYDLGEIAIDDEIARCLHQKHVIDSLRKDTLGSILDLKNLADMHLNDRRLDLSEKELLDVISRYKAIHFKKIHDSYYLLGAVYHLKGDLVKNLHYTSLAVRGMEATKDTAHADWFYSNLESAYYPLGFYDSCYYYVQKTIRFYKIRKNFFGEPLIDAVLVKIRKGHPKEALDYFYQQLPLLDKKDKQYNYCVYSSLAYCYFALRQYRKAEYCLKKLVDNTNVSISYTGYASDRMLRAYLRLCELYIALKDFPKATYYAEKIKPLVITRTSVIHLTPLELVYYKVDSANGKYISALKHYVNHNRLKDSLINLAKNIQIANLQVDFQVSQKDKDILLLKKQTIIKNQSLEQRRFQAKVLVGGIVLLVLLLMILYSRFVSRKRNMVALETARKEVTDQNQELQKLLQENEWLLKEVHHRVKNNLHIVMSLLQSQTIYLKDEGALNAVLDSQHRVQAMSLIHQKLYKSKDASSVYMPEYIAELVDYLKESFKTGLRIYFNLDIEPIIIDVMQAVPIGLILNEIITNSIKYAFPFSEEDEIKLSFHLTGKCQLTLTVSDNGRGLPANFDIDQSDSFGLLLIRGLIEDLGGTFRLENEHGTKFTLTFMTHQYSAFRREENG